MKQFTLQQIADIIRNKSYITKERFYHYFRIVHQFDDRKLREYWNVYCKFPFWDERYAPILEEIIETIDPLIQMRDIEPVDYSIRQETAPIIRQIHYTIDGTTHVLDADFSCPTDIIFYAEILKAGHKIEAILDFVDTIYGRMGNDRDSKDHKAYKGDIFVTRDEDYSSSSSDNIYVHDGDCYRRLLYTKGKGYLRKGQPDYDEGRYNHHVLTCCKNFRKIGNIYLDASVLIDNPKK